MVAVARNLPELPPFDTELTLDDITFPSVADNVVEPTRAQLRLVESEGPNNFPRDTWTTSQTKLMERCYNEKAVLGPQEERKSQTSYRPQVEFAPRLSKKEFAAKQAAMEANKWQPKAEVAPRLSRTEVALRELKAFKENTSAKVRGFIGNLFGRKKETATA